MPLPCFAHFSHIFPYFFQPFLSSFPKSLALIALALFCTLFPYFFHTFSRLFLSRLYPDFFSHFFTDFFKNKTKKHFQHFFTFPPLIFTHFFLALFLHFFQTFSTLFTHFSCFSLFYGLLFIVSHTLSPSSDSTLTVLYCIVLWKQREKEGSSNLLHYLLPAYLLILTG